jgi:hypothetical protein
VAGLGLVLWSVLARAGRPRAAWAALALAVLHPTVLRALEYGHPEEVVGGTLCVAAVALALTGRATSAGVVLGLAGANKPWAVLAVLPVLIALPRGHVRCLVAAGLACSAVLAPFVLTGSEAVASARAVATAGPELFKPLQLLWFLGEPAPVGGIEGMRVAPGWIGRLSHPALVLAGLATAAAWLPRRRAGTHPAGDALLLLALVLLTRCLLDVWTMTYYFAPFALALLAWEAGVRRRAPIASAAAAAALQLADVLPVPDAQAAVTLAWALPAWGLIALQLWAPERAARLAAAAARAARRHTPALAGLARSTG